MTGFLVSRDMLRRNFPHHTAQTRQIKMLYHPAMFPNPKANEVRLGIMEEKVRLLSTFLRGTSF